MENKEIKTLEELKVEIEDLFAQMILQHDKFVGGVKVSGTKSRSLSLQLGKLLKQYREMSLIRQKML